VFSLQVAITYQSVVMMEVINQYSVMMPWDNAGVWTSTAMSFMTQGRRAELPTARVLVSSPGFHSTLFPKVSIKCFELTVTVIALL